MVDKDSSNYEEYLLEEDQTQVEKVKSSCCYNIFCFKCCCREEKEISKTYYINKWRKYIVLIIFKLSFSQ
jgi:hypothetical protein